MGGLLAAIEAVDRENENVTEQERLEEFGHPERDFGRGSVAVYDGATMIGYSRLRRSGHLGRAAEADRGGGPLARRYSFFSAWPPNSLPALARVAQVFP